MFVQHLINIVLTYTKKYVKIYTTKTKPKGRKKEVIALTAEIMGLKKMRAGAREKILAGNPELRKAWQEAETSREKKPDLTHSCSMDAKGLFTFQCGECGNVFKAKGFYARCTCCGEDTRSMVSMM